MIWRGIGILLGIGAAALAAYGIFAIPPLYGVFWIAPSLLASGSVLLILAAEERLMRRRQTERARANAQQLQEMNKQQVHGERPDRKTI